MYLIGFELADVVKEIAVTKGSHARNTYLQRHFQTLIGHIVDYSVEGNQVEVLRHENFAVRTYLSLQEQIHHHFPTLCGCV
jgi:hypothetical protein